MERKQQHTLEKVYDSLRKKYEPEEASTRMHAAALLSYVGGVYNLTDKSNIPTPLYSLGWEESTQKEKTGDVKIYTVRLEGLKGKSVVPCKNYTEINALDLLISHHLRDIPLFWLGETGTGKTHLAENYFSIIVPEKNYLVRVLSSGVGGGNIDDVFKEGYLDNGILREKLNKSSLSQYVAMFIDELTRGNTNQIIGAIDGKTWAGGEVGRLGIEILEVTDEGIKSTGRKKKPQVVAAANPSGGIYTRTSELDGAIKNRFQIYDFSSIATETGSSLWKVEKLYNPHEKFLGSFAERMSKYTGVDKRLIEENLKRDWLSTLAWLTDPEKTRRDQLYSATEFTDMTSLVFSPDISKRFDEEKDIVASWNNQLYGYRNRFNLDGTIPKDTETIKRLEEIKSSLQEALMPRDVVKVKLLADAIKTTRDIKSAYCSEDPIQYYLDLRSDKGKIDDNAVTILDTAAAYSVLLQSKQKREGGNQPNVLDLVNASVKSYLEMEGAYNLNIGNKETFKYNDATRGIKNVAIAQSLHSTMKGSKDSRELIECFASQSNIINKLGSGQEIKQLMTAGLVSDIATLAGFVNFYAKDVNQIISERTKEYSSNRDIIPVARDLRGLFRKKQEEFAISFPDIFEQRLPRILG